MDAILTSMKKSVAIIGAGVSGLTVAQELKDRFNVVVYEKESCPGGLIRCKRIEGSLFHICGGHVFNSKRQDVLNWFWARFDKDKEFHKADRNSVVYMSDGSIIPYPIENHMYMMSRDIQELFINDLIKMSCDSNTHADNFEEFLMNRFGQTLYESYFRPYNEKVWQRPLNTVPLEWLEGKLPMPTVKEMIFNNFNHIEEKSFVHSTFYYENNDGSQFIADRLSKGLEIRYNTSINSMYKKNAAWFVNGEEFDIVVFAGNIKQLPQMLQSVDIQNYNDRIDALEYHGTTSVFCEIDANPYSWIYQPSSAHKSHRIICTGNFAASNNASEKLTATIEFTDEISKDEIIENLHKIPYHPKYIAHHYSKYTYPIQAKDTRDMIRALKGQLATDSLFLTGRFADWEYYNMDAAMGAAIDICKQIR